MLTETIEFITMQKREDIIKLIDENEKMIEDLNKILWLLEKHLDAGEKVKDVYSNVLFEIDQKRLIAERLKHALEIAEQNDEERSA